MSRPSRLVRAFIATRNLQRRAISLQAAIFEGFWLGMLDRDALAEVDEMLYWRARENVGDTKRSYRDEEYNLKGLHAWESEAIESAFPPGGRIVVTGAGAGREVIALLRRGYDAFGYEPNHRLVEAGESLLGGLGFTDRLSLVDRDAYPPTAARCDGVVVGWGSYIHIQGRSRRVAFLRAARVALPPGGPILVSFFLREGKSRRFDLIARLANMIRRLRGAERAELGDALRPAYMHHFTEREVWSEMEAAGFSVERFAAEPYGHVVGKAV